jgi:hypothetical protein
MNYELDFGKMSLAKKVMRLKHRENITLKQAWAKVLKRKSSPKRKRKSSPKRKRKSSPKRKKLSKKMLDSVSLKKLQKLAKKHKISIYRKNSRTPLKKKSLLAKMKKSRSINKILMSVSKMKKRTRFGSPMPNTPRFATPLELQLGQTYEHQKKHYMNTPTSFLSHNMPPNFKYAVGSLGKSSLPSYRNINAFGSYFH